MALDDDEANLLLLAFKKKILGRMSSATAASATNRSSRIVCRCNHVAIRSGCYLATTI